MAIMPTLAKMPHRWKSLVTAQVFLQICFVTTHTLTCLECELKSQSKYLWLHRNGLLNQMKCHTVYGKCYQGPVTRKPYPMTRESVNGVLIGELRPQNPTTRENWPTKIVSEYDQEKQNHKLQINPWHREEEPHNNHETPGRHTKQSNQLSFFLFPIKMIVKLEGILSNVQQNIEQLQTPTMGVTINNKSTTTEPYGKQY